jgi:hypothetical protein
MYLLQGNPGYPGSVWNGGSGGGAGGAATFYAPDASLFGPGATNSLLGVYVSSTSVAIGTGSKTFTVATSLNFAVDENVTVYYNSSNYMLGVITSYNSGTGVLVVNVIRTFGSGTYASWTISRMYASGGQAYQTIALPGMGTNNNTGNGANPGSSPGASGVVLISVPNTGSVTFSGGVTSTMTTVGTKKVYKVTATSTTSETYTVTVP